MERQLPDEQVVLEQDQARLRRRVELGVEQLVGLHEVSGGGHGTTLGGGPVWGHARPVAAHRPPGPHHRRPAAQSNCGSVVRARLIS